MTANELRKKYLDFMKKKGHVIVPSASLLPENDPTTLFTGSGMQPMVPYLLGEKHPEGTRISDSQKSFRSVDIEEVGDNRHTTFFEMLGNWSLGDYFKREQIEWMFEFLTEELKLSPKRIYVTVFRGNEKIGISRDDESVAVWKEQFQKAGIDAKDVDFSERDGMGDGRIFYYDDKKNWWSRAGVPANMPLGEPGGPDSEMFWDFGAQLEFHENSPWKDEPCHVNCDCGRFMEIGNNVFMEFVKTEKGFEKLSQKNVDYGGGLERQAAAVSDNPDIFLTDIFEKPLAKLEELSGRKYAENKEAFRVILDHLRASTFLISDGALPSNKDQGYFVRRLVRRAVRFAHKLGVENNYCSEISKTVVEYYKEEYPDLEKNKKKVFDELEREESKFRKTLEKGLRQFERTVDLKMDDMDKSWDSYKKTWDNYEKKILGKQIFDLYTTYGFPKELIVEEAEERDIEIPDSSWKDFEELFEKHQELSRTAAEGKFKGGLADHSEKTTQLHTAAHLMLSGLRKVLGDGVHQKGSNITEERIRFDFSHGEKMTEEQKKAVEDFVNQAISAKVPVEMKEMTLEEAREIGAEGAFENKYGERVKVYIIEGFSKEICGGPHVENTADIKGAFKIKKEESSSAGVRRIKAVIT